MSEDRVVSLAGRRPARQAEPITGTITFSNAQLRLPFMKLHHAPRWMITSATAKVDGRQDLVSIDVALVDESLDEPGSYGWLDQLEHGLAGEFALGEAYAQLIWHAAFSPVPLEIVLGFGAEGDGEISALMMSIERAGPPA